MHPLIGEFFGTFVMILFGSGVCATVNLKGSYGYNGGWLVITTAWAFAVMMGIFVAIAAGAPEADLNPAVTISKLFLGVYHSYIHVIEIMIAELLGAFFGAVIAWLAYLPHWSITEDEGAKLGVFCTSPAIPNKACNLLSEAIGAFALIFGIGAIVHSHVAASDTPYYIGMLVWVIGLSLGGATGYAINPARDLGPRIAHAILPLGKKGSSHWEYCWVPIIGPIIGASIGSLAWILVFTQ